MNTILRVAIIFVAAFLTAVLYAVFLAPEAHAMTILGAKDSCSALGRVSESLAYQRDNGLGWEAAKSMTDAQIDEAMGVKNSIIMDNDDAAYARKTVNEIWNGKYKTMEPGEVGVDVFLSCMKKI